MILLIETATNVCSVALTIDGEILAMREDPPPASHASRITLMIGECLREANAQLTDLKAIAVSRGPGSYTGLRVGTATAKGLCYALNIPLIAVDTLEALARASHSTDHPDSLYFPMIDARRNEVWMAAYDARFDIRVDAQPFIIENNLFERFLEEHFPAWKKNYVIFSGNGAFKLENGRKFENMVFSPVKTCSSAFLASIAVDKLQRSEFQDISYFEPFYMKPPNITVPKKI